MNCLDLGCRALCYRPKPNAVQDGGRDAREKPQERSRDRRRSRSPRREREVEREKEKPKPKVAEEESTKSRTATPPVSFKVGLGDRPGSSHSHDRMDTDEDMNTKKGKKAKKAKAKVEVPDEDDDNIIVEDDGMAAMQAMMGFGGFSTTQNKKVPGNDVSAVRKEKKTEYRQYMNRAGGFNRPLSPTRD